MYEQLQAAERLEYAGGAERDGVSLGQLQDKTARPRGTGVDRGRGPGGLPVDGTGATVEIG